MPADARRSVLVDLLTVYGEGGKAIVFTQTKREADEVAASVGGHLPCGALHGDMSQREREKVLNAFRANKVSAGAGGAGGCVRLLHLCEQLPLSPAAALPCLPATELLLPLPPLSAAAPLCG